MTGATALADFDIIAMQEHTDVAAMVRIAIVHLEGKLLLLPRTLPDADMNARRGRLVQMQGGLDRLRSEQKARGIGPPSRHDAGAIQKKGPAQKKGSGSASSSMNGTDAGEKVWQYQLGSCLVAAAW